MRIRIYEQEEVGLHESSLRVDFDVQPRVSVFLKRDHFMTNHMDMANSLLLK